MMGEMNGRFGEINGRLNTVDEMNVKLGELNNKFGDLTQTVNLHSQSIAKLEAQVGQIVNSLNRREEGKLPSQSVVNPKGLYMVNETSHLEQVQAITILRSRNWLTIKSKIRRMSILRYQRLCRGTRVSK
jgi:hypothetical protein